ncbi:hypothetical protein HDU99_001376 [Rhizoclosmatium hyalinum]|nr:hypothetical protein HDU99_001376 [Rhizoclosmatium hyalinum]
MNTAISAINNSSDILPDVHINIKRFSSCGPYDPKANDDYNGSPIGYASAIMSEDIVNIHTDVIAVIGSDISSVTIPTAEILSIYQIPYCSICAASPALSNKDMFSYFWRPQLENFGEALVVFLQALNVKQIAVLYQPFSSYGYVSQEVVSEAQRYGIRIASKLALSQSTSVSPEEAFFVAQSLNRVSARYIVLIGESSKTAGILYWAGKLGIFGPDFVWLLYNEPTSSSPLIEYGPDYEIYISNYICVGRTDINLTAIANQFYSYNQIAKSDLSYSDLFQNSNVRLSTDCVMNMMYGLDKADDIRLRFKKVYNGFRRNQCKFYNV